MSLIRDLKRRRLRREGRVKAEIFKNKQMPRVSVYKSLNYIYGQVIDDKSGNTLASCSSLELKDAKGDKTAVSKAIGIELAKRAKKHGVSAIRFDRGRFLYHGRIKAFAEGLREGGLQF